MTGRHSQE